MYLAFNVDSMTFMVGSTFFLHNVNLLTERFILSDGTGKAIISACHTILFFIVKQIVPVVRRTLTIQEEFQERTAVFTEFHFPDPFDIQHLILALRTNHTHLTQGCVVKNDVGWHMLFACELTPNQTQCSNTVSLTADGE